MESKFPGYTLQKLDVYDAGKGVELEKRLNVRNTLVKLGLDQTVGAVVNVVAYIGGSRALRGVPLEECWVAVREACDTPLCVDFAYADCCAIANVACHESGL